MKITNKYGLPDAIVRAVENDPYTKGDADYSISDLIAPPRQVILKNTYWDYIEEDASDRIWSLFGQAVHHIAERASITDTVERRLYWMVGNKRISGAMDHYNAEKGILTDYKTASVFKFLVKNFKDWEAQQNCYAQLLRWHGEKIERLQIVAFVRDWRIRERSAAYAKGEPYPNPAVTVTLCLWPEKRAIEFIEARVKALDLAKNALPLCSEEERWARPSTWAIKRYGQKNAVSGHAGYTVRSFAEKALAELGPGHYLEQRVGTNQRCENYCSVADFCVQFTELKG